MYIIFCSFLLLGEFYMNAFREFCLISSFRERVRTPIQVVILAPSTFSIDIVDKSDGENFNFLFDKLFSKSNAVSNLSFYCVLLSIYNYFWSSVSFGVTCSQMGFHVCFPLFDCIDTIPTIFVDYLIINLSLFVFLNKYCMSYGVICSWTVVEIL